MSQRPDGPDVKPEKRIMKKQFLQAFCNQQLKYRERQSSCHSTSAIFVFSSPHGKRDVSEGI